jgi:hypothetical protein
MISSQVGMNGLVASLGLFIALLAHNNRSLALMSRGLVLGRFASIDLVGSGHSATSTVKVQTGSLLILDNGGVSFAGSRF